MTLKSQKVINKCSQGVGNNTNITASEQLQIGVNEIFAKHHYQVMSEKIKLGLARRKVLLANQKAVVVATTSSNTTK